MAVTEKNLAKGESITTRQAEARAECVWLLDCWSFNTSKAFRETVQKFAGGRIQIMYVAAGGTGRYQVNDTHMYKPLKGHAQIVAGRWYCAYLFHLNKVRWPPHGSSLTPISSEDYGSRVNLLMSLPRLRDMAPLWLNSAVKHIAKP